MEVNLKQEMGITSYHSVCYKNYTAVKRPSTDSQSDPPPKKAETRNRSSMPSTDAKGLLKGSCIFCSVHRKTLKGKVESLSNCLTTEGCDAITAAAPKSKNDRVKALVASGVDLIAKEAQYHKSCRREFFREIEQEQAGKAVDISKKCLHAISFEALSDLIKTEIIGNGRPMFSKSILELYKNEFLSAGGKMDDIKSYTVQALMKKVKDRFGESISISCNQPQGNFVYSSDMSAGDAWAILHDDAEEHLHIIRTADQGHAKMENTNSYLSISTEGMFT